MIIGAYDFVRRTHARSIHALMRLTTTRGGVIVANYLTRRFRRRLLRRVPRTITLINAKSCGQVIRIVRQTRTNRQIGVISPRPACVTSRAMPHCHAATSDITCVQITRNYSCHYTFYVVPRLQNGRQSQSVRSVITRTGRLTSRKIRRLILVSRVAAGCNLSLCNGPRLTRLLQTLNRISIP